jgi:hypothetical protein
MGFITFLCSPFLFLDYLLVFLVHPKKKKNCCLCVKVRSSLNPKLFELSSNKMQIKDINQKKKIEDN